jgi:hypothetical protein
LTRTVPDVEALDEQLLGAEADSRTLAGILTQMSATVRSAVFGALAP